MLDLQQIYFESIKQFWEVQFMSTVLIRMGLHATLTIKLATVYVYDLL